MPLSLNNSKDIIANSISILKGNRTIDVLETIDAVSGLAPETLNSLEKLATAMNNDPGFFTTLSTDIDAKQDKLITSSIPANTGRLFETDSTNFRAINVSTPLSITATRSDYLTIASDTYDKANIDGKLTTINTNITNKQATLSNGTTATNSKAILFGNIIKNIVPGTNISLTSDDNNITITGIDAYDKTNIDGR